MIAKSRIPPPSDGTLVFPTFESVQHALQTRHKVDVEAGTEVFGVKYVGGTKQKRRTIITSGLNRDELDIIRSNPEAAFAPPSDYDWVGAFRERIERKGRARTSNAPGDFVLREEGVLDSEALEVIRRLRMVGKGRETLLRSTSWCGRSETGTAGWSEGEFFARAFFVGALADSGVAGTRGKSSESREQ